MKSFTLSIRLILCLLITSIIFPMYQTPAYAAATSEMNAPTGSENYILPDKPEKLAEPPSSTYIKQIDTCHVIIDLSGLDDIQYAVMIIQPKDEPIHFFCKQNDYLVFALTDGNGTYEIKLLYQVKGTLYKAFDHLTVTAKASETSPYLDSTLSVHYDSELQNLSTDICRQASSNLDKADAIQTFLSQVLEYDYDKARNPEPKYRTDNETILHAGCGICLDYATLMTAMLRSMNIPAKLIYGYPPNAGYHAWVEVWDGTHWVRYDPTWYDALNGEYDPLAENYVTTNWF